jgi:CRP-like cAMP-binding protein
MFDKHLMKLRARDDVSQREEQLLRSLVSEERRVAARKTIIRAGEELETSTLLLEGMMCRYKDLRDGSRQICELHVAGDFVDLHSFTLKKLDHNIMSLTACTTAVVPHERLYELTEHEPHLTRLLWFSTNVDAAIHREWVLSLGRRKALSRLAHFFCELQCRLEIVGLADETGYTFELTQADVAECMGLTNVHVNRTLKSLREMELLEFRDKQVRILNLPELQRVGEFKPDYLRLEHRPR